MAQVKCTGCGAGYRVPPAFAGLRFRCKHCGTRFVAPGTRTRVGDLPAWLRLRDIDTDMVLQTAEALRKPAKTGKTRPVKKLTADELRWQQLITDMYGDATDPRK